MKLSVLPSFILLLLLTCSAAVVKSQPFYGAVSAGINLSQVDGDEKYGFHKIGFNGGPAVMWPFGKDKRWSLTMELLYSQLGSYAASEYGMSDTIVDSTQYYDGYKLKLDYVQVPLLLHYTDKQMVAGGIGFLYGRVVNQKEWEDHNDPRGLYRTDTLGKVYNDNDFQFLADVRIRIYKRFWANLRYSYSILPIRTRTFENPYTHTTWTRKQYNNVITIRLTYIINDPLPARKKKSKE
jgi:hypothetical protein